MFHHLVLLLRLFQTLAFQTPEHSWAHALTVSITQAERLLRKTDGQKFTWLSTSCAWEVMKA